MDNKRFLLTLTLALGACGVSLSSAQAQPDVNAAPKTDNPPNWNMGGGRRGGGGGGGRQFQAMTPEQLKQMRTQATEMRALNIKQQLTMAGYTDDTVQTAVVDYYKAQENAKATLLDQWQKIAQAVQAKNVTDTQMATMLNDFRAAVDKEKERRETAYQTLSTTLELSKKPMLDAMLMTMGLAGDESTIVGQGGGAGLGGLLNMLGIGGGMAGMGGPGGPMGGGGGMFALPGGMGNFEIRGGMFGGGGPGGGGFGGGQGGPGGPDGGGGGVGF